MVSAIPFFELFEQINGFQPYPWQHRLYESFCEGSILEELALPTGTGKTSAAMLYLLALINGADLPRRLVYVVDRRAIVDQTAECIERWVNRIEENPDLAARLNERGAFPMIKQLIPVGILRGGIADTGGWRMDPARPAVIVGTVDMIGSRLLFAGYGDGRTRRSLHAGLLGYDTTVMLDEAHLSPAMEHLLRSICEIQAKCWKPRFEVLTMSATPREGALSLAPEDVDHPQFNQRLTASKHCRLHELPKGKDQCSCMAKLALRHRAGAVLCFVRKVDDATKLHKALVKEVGQERVGLLTGTLRGSERSTLSSGSLWARFLPNRERCEDHESVFLVSTAAGEVGVDLDADHAVMDLVPVDSVIQRLGRVNRAGTVARAEVDVVYAEADIERSTKPKKDWNWKARLIDAQYRTLEILTDLQCASPLSLMEIDPEQRKKASAPMPHIGKLDRSRIDLMAATSVPERDQAISVFLRGHSDEPEPETQIVWRRDVCDIARTVELAESALGMFPPLPEEVLKAPTRTVEKELKKIANRVNSRCLFLLRDRTGATKVYNLADSATGLPDIQSGTLFLPACAGGLSSAGLLDASSKHPVRDLADNEETRIRFVEGEEIPDWVDGAARLRIPLHDPDADDERWLVYVRRDVGEMTLGADTDDLTRLATKAQTLVEHGQWVGKAAETIAKSVGLPDDLIEAVRSAGAWHDAGKRRDVWQRAAGSQGNPPMAKSTSGAMRSALLGGFRHEFGSLSDALNEGSFSDLALHLIAAHHGHARPGFPNPRQWDPELSDEVSAHLAEEVEKRFASQQYRFGPYGLAWLESLVKAADAWVSAGHKVSE